jgi:hypothetical protein
MGPDGGLLLLPDGGVVGGPCRPSECTEIACDDGIDNNGDGRLDCEDPSCVYRTCRDSDPCTFGETCLAGQCRAATTLSCNSPPPGPCYQNPGTCTPEGCIYPVTIGASGQCPSGQSCTGGGTCAASSGELGFSFTPSNFNPANVMFSPDVVEVLSGSVGFDSTTNTFSGNWGQVLPIINTINTPSGQAVLLGADGFDFGVGVTVTLRGNRPIILASTGGFILEGVIDASGIGATPGPGGNVGCGASAGGTGGVGTNSAAGGGGAGGPAGAGAPGGGGSTFTTGGTAGVAFSRPANSLFGGCPGGNGGNSGGLGGGGGGSLQISAALGIAMQRGAIVANGGGGRGGAGTDGRGGGGGGSAGSIILESEFVYGYHMRIFAVGGGGGEGSGYLTGGANGFDGNVVAYSWATAPGGSGRSGNGGNGGNGGGRFYGPGAGAPGTQYWWDENTAYEAGGGGGGGAAGIFRINIAPGGRCALPMNVNQVAPYPIVTGAACQL